MSTVALKQIQPVTTGALVAGNGAGQAGEVAPGAVGDQVVYIGGVPTTLSPAFVTGVNPDATYDGVDTAGVGRPFVPGNIVINNSVSPALVWMNENNATGAAVWRNITFASQGAFNYAGVVDASNTTTDNLATLLTNGANGDTFVVNATGGTQNFNGTWDANANTQFLGATFEVGDYIIIRDGAFDKIDNTDPVGVQVFKDFTFSEAGPGTPATGNHVLTGTLPLALQDGNLNSVRVSINGVRITAGVSLSGAGPFNVTLDMAVIGYPLDANDTVSVDYSAAS